MKYESLCGIPGQVKRRGKKITSLSNLVINSTNFFYPLFATQEDPRMNRNTRESDELTQTKVTWK